ncbi:MAG: hypothetical protein OXC08_20750 [Thiotrichales bacterium]|nr:hypothetical protein [Thiotrichales bacterium]
MMTVTRRNMLSMQVCVPATTKDAEVLAFAETNNPCGTEAGWQIRREGDDLLRGAPERVSCQSVTDHVHIMLDA